MKRHDLRKSWKCIYYSDSILLYYFVLSTHLECFCLGWPYAYTHTRGLQRDVFHLGWLMAPSYLRSNFIFNLWRFFYFKLAAARYKNRNLKPRNRNGRLKNRNSKQTDTIGRYKNRNLRPRNRIGRLKNRNSKQTNTIGRYKNQNLTSTDCIVQYNRKIKSVSENRSIGPFAHLWFWGTSTTF